MCIRDRAKPELSQLLDGNFLCFDSNSSNSLEVPSQIHSYLSSNWAEYRNLEKSDSNLKSKAADRWYVPDPNKAQELEKLREKSLLKEFDIYKTSTLRKLKEFRLEAVRAGFKFCWGNRDYATIMAVAKKIPDDVLQEDEKLLLWYDPVSYTHLDVYKRQRFQRPAHEQRVAVVAVWVNGLEAEPLIEAHGP